eukprot:NODE_2903_length_625_cov_110.263889_g2420_i0.p2 GENE.NODE_2903_length_625_cov_110.263889_g2420_i0~~NODE_2903_length_625_cov_110.263889_g2420_i0.p2  ORF type:complete len:98 (-),score=29.20 NODE_2903_length_625_cov_110.263889_g2420_i0:3-296(-)
MAVCAHPALGATHTHTATPHIPHTQSLTHAARTHARARTHTHTHARTHKTQRSVPPSRTKPFILRYLWLEQAILLIKHDVLLSWGIGLSALPPCTLR